MRFFDGMDIDFCDDKVYCDICNKPTKDHVDEFIDHAKDYSKPSMLNKECYKNTSIFIGNRWHRYNKEDGTLSPYQCSNECCDWDDDDEEE